MTASSSSSAAGSVPSNASARHPLAIPVGLIVAAAVIVLDQATKELAEHLLERGRYVPWLGEHIGWQLVYNPGAAFGLPAPLWLPLSVTVVVVIIVARTLPRTTHLLPAASYGLLLAGAVGNVLDRLFRVEPGGGFGTGEVVDFVAWGDFWRFNVADSAITVGFVLLVVALWQDERRPAAPVGTAGMPDAGADRSDERADQGQPDGHAHGHAGGPSDVDGPSDADTSVDGGPSAEPS